MENNNTQTSHGAARQSGGRSHKRHAKKSPLPILIIIVVLLAVGGTVWGMGADAFNKDTISAGVRVMDIDLGGKTYDDALTTLSELGNVYADSTVILTSGTDNKLDVNSTNIELTSNFEKTVTNAIEATKGNVFSAMGSRMFGTNIEVVNEYSHEKLEELITSFAKNAGGTLKQHQVDVGEDTVTITAGNSGLGIDTNEAKRMVIDLLKPHIKSQSVIEMKNTSPADIKTDELALMVARDKQDAKYSLANGSVTVASDVDGRELDKKDAESKLRGFKEGSAPVTLNLIMTPADIKASDLSMNLFKDTLGSYKTTYDSSNKNRSNNVALAAKFINGTILLPGDVFSYNKTVGPRTAARGFKEASVYENNKSVDGLGGGICQTNSTLYCAVLYANLEVVERHEHSLEVHYAPLGMDATVAYGYLDFQFKNNTNAPLKVVASAVGGNCSVSLVGTDPDPGLTVKINTETVAKVPKGTTEINDSSIAKGSTVVDSPGFDGYTVNTYKVLYRNGKEVENKFLHKSVYNMANKIVRKGTKAVAETPAENVPASGNATASPSPSPSVPTPTPGTIPGADPSVYPDGL